MTRKRLPASVPLRAADLRAAVKRGECAPDKAASGWWANIYRFTDGRAAVQFGDGRCRAYESHQDLVEWYQETERDAARGFSWKSVIPMGSSFPSDVQRLIGETPAWLGGGSGPPDLPKVERAVRKLGQQKVLTAEVFPYVLAHVGEAIRNLIGGEWKTLDRGQGPEPYLQLAGRRECQVVRVYKHIMEHDRRVSIRAFVEQGVWSHRG